MVHRVLGVVGTSRYLGMGWRTVLSVSAQGQCSYVFSSDPFQGMLAPLNEPNKTVSLHPMEVLTFALRALGYNFHSMHLLTVGLGSRFANTEQIAEGRSADCGH